MNLNSDIIPVQALLGGKLLAVGDEEGIVTILNTARPMPDALSRGKANAQWLGHQNAIFCLHWYQVKPLHLAGQCVVILSIQCASAIPFAV